jgi:hypothetical protein
MKCKCGSEKIQQWTDEETDSVEFACRDCGNRGSLLFIDIIAASIYPVPKGFIMSFNERFAIVHPPISLLDRPEMQSGLMDLAIYTGYTKLFDLPK